MSNSETEDLVIEKSNWDSNDMKCLITSRLNLEQQFVSNRSKNTQLWKIVHREILKIKPDFQYSIEACKYKFTNLLTSYKRIKKRTKLSGRNPSNWSYFPKFDEVYGLSSFIIPPKETLASSLENTFNRNSSTLQNNDNEIDEENDGEINRSRTNGQKRKANEILDFLRTEAELAEKRHTEILEFEKKRYDLLDKILRRIQNSSDSD